MCSVLTNTPPLACLLPHVAGAASRSALSPCLLQLAKCCSVVFERANHWLYLEMPKEFNELLLDFIKRGNEGRPAVTSVE